MYSDFLLMGTNRKEREDGRGRGKGEEDKAGTICEEIIP